MAGSIASVAMQRKILRLLLDFTISVGAILLTSRISSSRRWKSFNAKKRSIISDDKLMEKSIR
jgi:hypothetical protein